MCTTFAVYFMVFGKYKNGGVILVFESFGDIFFNYYLRGEIELSICSRQIGPALTINNTIKYLHL